MLDPPWASGYEYVADGPKLASVTLPGPAVGLPQIGDNLFDLWLFDSLTGEYSDSDIDLRGGVPFDFALLEPDGVDRFQIRGIEPTAMLDPDDPTAFPTGLTAMEPGALQLTQTPLVSEEVSAPPVWALILAGPAVIAGVRGLERALHSRACLALPAFSRPARR
ncbi:MAG: hypothetical protein GVY09_12460 [Gammaproteobacteria bacterium]|jgi:hypothetical protein|nr:hypothetical protein [Gammaproteobacteria bacterium]